MAWLFQGVLNAGLQILLSIFGGWLCAYLKLVDPEVLSRQLNAFAMRAAFPAFIIHLLGVKTNLQDLRAWRALGVFILWVFLIHLCCFVWHKLRRGQATVSHLGLNCLLLSTNNTGCIGWPVLIATVGRQGAALSMLLGVLFFIQLLPVTIACFEYQKWIDMHGKDGEAASIHEAGKDVEGKLPTTALSKEQETTGFPHEFRYCYWSMADYHPQKVSKPDGKSVPAKAESASTRTSATAYPKYVEVYVDHSDGHEEEVHEHHCYSGIQRSTQDGPADFNSDGRRSGGCNNCSSSNGGGTKDSNGKEWWQTGPPKWVYEQQQKRQVDPGTNLQPLKRAKDSCDSLYSPFGATTASSKVADMQEQPQVVQSSRPVVKNITRRSSRTLSSKAATAAVAAVGAPATLVRAASGKLKAQQQVESKCDMGVPLMTGHEGVTSCQAGMSAAAAASGADAATRRTSAGDDSSAQPTAAAPPCSFSSCKDVSKVLPYASVAADSAVELHHMVPNTSEQELFRLEQQAAVGNSCNSFLSNRPFSNSSRVDSKTGLLGMTQGRQPAAAAHGPPGYGSNAGNSKSKLGAAAAVGAPCPGAGGSKNTLVKQGSLAAVRYSPFVRFVKGHPLLMHITINQLKSFHLWLNLIAIALSVSGARKYLDPDAPEAIPALGFIDGVLAWFSSACIPVLLFANGVWMCGKDVFGGKRGQLQVTLLLMLKLTVLPAVMVGLTLICNMRDEYGLSLVLLTACPLAPLAFLVCQQYGLGAELATSVTIQGVLLMLPQMMAIIKIAQVAQLYNVSMLKMA